MTAMTLREELIEKIARLPEKDLLFVAPAIREIAYARSLTCRLSMFPRLICI